MNGPSAIHVINIPPGISLLQCFLHKRILPRWEIDGPLTLRYVDNSFGTVLNAVHVERRNSLHVKHLKVHPLAARYYQRNARLCRLFAWKLAHQKSLSCETHARATGEFSEVLHAWRDWHALLSFYRHKLVYVTDKSLHILHASKNIAFSWGYSQSHKTCWNWVMRWGMWPLHMCREVVWELLNASLDMSVFLSSLFFFSRQAIALFITMKRTSNCSIADNSGRISEYIKFGSTWAHRITNPCKHNTYDYSAIWLTSGNGYNTVIIIIVH